MESFRSRPRLLANWMVLGDVLDLDARKILSKALDNGVNFFDTSDVCDGRSERFLSEIIIL